MLQYFCRSVCLVCELSISTPFKHQDACAAGCGQFAAADLHPDVNASATNFSAPATALHKALGIE